MLANGCEPLAGQMIKDRDMRLQKVAGSRKVVLSQAIEGLDIIGLDVSGYDHWR